MATLIICEKAKQAQNVRAAVGNRYGDILAAQGHIIRLKMPDEVNPDWAKWNDDILVPPGGRYPFAEDPKKGHVFRPIRDALKKATDVILATDADREGQMLGQELLEFCKFKGKVRRVMFSAEDPKSIQDAFAKMADNSKYEPLYQAALARANGDQIFNLSMTRIATRAMRAPGEKGVIGVGRVKTPTLGIVCRRYLDIRDFVPTTYYNVRMDVASAASNVDLWHKRAHTNLITDKAEAEHLAAAARLFKGPISVSQKRASENPPKPHSLTSLTSAVSPLGIKPKEVLEIAQALYDEHKIATYPRSDVRYLPESMQGDAGPIVNAVLAMSAFSSLKNHGFGTPKIRTGKTGTFSDAGLKGEPHHAIIPNVNQISAFATVVPRLSKNERLVFEEICRAYLITTGPDHIYDQTSLSAEVQVPAKGPVKFSRVGRVTIVPGWRAAIGSGPKQPEADDDDDVAGALPPFTDGEAITAKNAEPVACTTHPPKPIMIGKLPELMANAWQEVKDPVERDRLKEAKGIGQTSTRTEIISGLLAQQLIADVSGRAEPTPQGLELFQSLEKYAPVLNDPAATARMEMMLDDIVQQKTDYDTVVAAIIAQATSIRDTIKINAKPLSSTGGRLPSLNGRSAGKGGKPAAKAGAKPSASSSKPSASASGSEATPAQINLVKQLIARGKSAPSGWPARIPTRVEASNWISAAMGQR